MWRWGIAAALLLGVLHVAARARGAPRAAGVLKPLPILLLAVLAACEPAPVAPAFRMLVVAALVFSMAGDVWLLAPERFFVAGLASFLVAHLLYIGAFMQPRGAAPSGGLLLLPLLVAGGGMLAVLWPRLGRDRVPVVVYVAVIVAMAWRAAARADAPTTPSPSGGLALAGALLFMVSDGLLAVDRFRGGFAAAQTAIMATYYAAQTLIALSVRS